MRKRQSNEYTTLKIPKALAIMLDNYLTEHKEYTSRTDIVKEALRDYLKN